MTPSSDPKPAAAAGESACPPGPLNCAECRSRELSEWWSLSDEEVKLLDAAKVPGAYAPGSVVFHQGNPCAGIYCITQGTVALRRTSADGASIIVGLAEAGQTMGYRAFFANGPYALTAEAATDARICFIDRQALRGLLDRNPSVGLNFMGRMAQDLEQSERGRLAVTTQSARCRLAHLLLVLKERHGRTDARGRLVIDLPLTRQGLAAMIGSRPETLSRAVSALQADRVVVFRGQRAIVSDLDELLDEVQETRLG